MIAPNLSGKNLYTYIWETNNKTSTLRSVYQTLTDEQYNSASSGDFAIVVDNRAVNIKNMKIWDSADVLKSSEDYSEYTNILDPTVYNFDDGNFGDISNAKSKADLPPQAIKYLNRIEEYVGVPVKFIGTGAGRENMIIVK